MAAIIALVSALAIDVEYSIFLNASNGGEGPAVDSLELRQANSQVLMREYRPRDFYPTDKNFRIFKPRATVPAEAYGQFYTDEMATSATNRTS